MRNLTTHYPTVQSCYSKYGNLQRIYPTKPTYLPGVEEASSTFIECDTSKQNDGADSEIEEKRKERQVMLKMNEVQNDNEKGKR